MYDRGHGWGFIVDAILDLLKRSPEMRRIEDKVWDRVLSSVHPIWGERSITAKANIRSMLCEYLSDHLGRKAAPCSKVTPDFGDWLYVVCVVVQFMHDNPKLREVEAECWEWVLNQVYPLPPNHAPTACGMVKPVLENFMGDFGQVVSMIEEYEAKDAAKSYPNAEAATRVEQMVENVPGLLTEEAAAELEKQLRPDDSKAISSDDPKHPSHQVSTTSRRRRQ